MLYLFGILLSFFLALVLFTKKGKSNADILLASWLTIIGLHLAVFYAFGITNSPYAILGFPLPLIHGPLLYFYTARVTNQHNNLKIYGIWHLLPILLSYALLMPFILLPYTEKMLVLENKGQDFEIESLIINTLIDFSGLFYFVFSLWLLRKHAKNIQDCFSHTEKINLNWLRYLIYGIGLIWIAVLTRHDVAIYSLVSLFIIFLGYFGIKQVGIFTQTSTIPMPENADTIENVFTETDTETQKTTSHSPNKALHLELHRNLKILMENEKPFLNPELTIGDLAALLQTHPNILSLVINTLESKPFYDYINEKRIAEFTQIALDPANQKFTMLTLAYDCGFNSKTSFYRNFKKNLGQSPTEYLKQMHIAIK